MAQRIEVPAKWEWRCLRCGRTEVLEETAASKRPSQPVGFSTSGRITMRCDALDFQGAILGPGPTLGGEVCDDCYSKVFDFASAVSIDAEESDDPVTTVDGSTVIPSTATAIESNEQSALLDPFEGITAEFDGGLTHMGPARIILRADADPDNRKMGRLAEWILARIGTLAPGVSDIDPMRCDHCIAAKAECDDLGFYTRCCRRCEDTGGSSHKARS